MMEVTSTVKPASGSAFSIDSIMSRDRDGSSSGGSTSSDRIGGGLLSIAAPRPSTIPVASTSCACPVSPDLLAASSVPHHPHGQHSPSTHHTPPLTESIQSAGLLHHGLPRASNGMHTSLPLSAAEAAIMHNQAQAAAVRNVHSLHSHAAMASLSALDAHNSAAATAAALTAGGVGTIPTLPSFSTLGHHRDQGLATLQALSHKMQGLPPTLAMPGPSIGHHPGLGVNGLNGGLAGLAPKHVLPFYSWFSRPGYWAHRLPGNFKILFILYNT